ncbi:kinase-like domain-containing protein, partial [Mucidula mucida]
WLFERLRTRESQKWSGTNMHPSHNNNKLGNIMNAFAHFVYEASQNTVVLADIQTSTFNNKDILFDLMTHTKTGNSIIGDHGKAGIRTFIDTHGC